MSNTLGFTGMDSATESALQAAFNSANARTGGRWQLLSEQDADFVVVDMDSMYGPMSWLRLHANGKRVIGLTSAARTQTDFRLPRPFDADAVATLLAELEGGSPGEAAPAVDTVDATPEPEPAPAHVEPARPAGMTPAPQPYDQLPEEQPTVVGEELPPQTEPLSIPTPTTTAPASHEPPSVAVGQVLPAAPSIAPHVPAPVVAPDTLAGWLRAGRVQGRVRFSRGGASVLIDAPGQQYVGPPALKPLAPLFEGEVAAGDFEPVAAADWERESAATGTAQPLARLVWFGALVAGQGTLAPGYDPGARYQLLKWPQTEREFPKHFRIATAMMKGPATLAEIAEGSSVPVADVADFVNANLATGFAEPWREPVPEPDAGKTGGLFGRLRGR